MGKKPKQQSESEPKVQEKAKIRTRIHASPKYNTYKEASDFKTYVLGEPALMSTGVDVIKIKKRAGDKFQVICYSKPE
jgi:hypothetical protein